MSTSDHRKARALKDLADHYPGVRLEERNVRAYLKALKDASTDEVVDAVAHAVRSDERFPSVARLWRHIREHRQEHRPASPSRWSPRSEARMTAADRPQPLSKQEWDSILGHGRSPSLDPKETPDDRRHPGADAP